MLSTIGTILSLGLNLAAKDKSELPSLRRNAPKEERDAYANRQKNNETGRRAKRFLAVLVGLVWAFSILAPVVVEMLGHEPLASLNDVRKEVHWPFTVVILAYFSKDGVNAGLAKLKEAVSNVLK